MKKVLNILIFIILFIWQILQNIIALCMLPFLGTIKLIEINKHTLVLKASKMSGDISLGSIIIMSSSDASYRPYIEHELGHAVDSKMMGPLYLFIIGLPSILHAWLHTDCPCYYHFFTERRANENAGTIEVVKYQDGRCDLIMKKEKA